MRHQQEETTTTTSEVVINYDVGNGRVKVDLKGPEMEVKDRNISVQRNKIPRHPLVISRSNWQFSIIIGTDTSLKVVSLSLVL